MTCGPSHLTPAQQQFGNKNAVGNKGGRQRTVSLPPEEMELLGQEMVTWCAENKPLHLSQWWSIHKDISDDDWETMKKRPEFIRYYMKAMRIIGYSYIDKDSKVDVRVKDRWQRVYFKDLAKQEDEDAKFKALLNAELEKKEDKDLIDKFNMLCQAFQKAQSDRKIDDKSNNKE